MNILTLPRLAAAAAPAASLEASGDPAASTAPTLWEALGGAWDAVVYGVSWFFRNMAPAGVWVLVALAVCLAFFI